MELNKNRILSSVRWLACASALAMGAFASAQAGLDRKVDLFLVDGDLDKAVQMLTKQTGIEFFIVPTEEPFGKINLSLKGKTADEAIRYLCEAAGAYAEADESGVFIIRRGSKPATASANNPLVKATAPKIIKRITVRHGDAAQILQMIKGEYNFDPAAPFRELRGYWNEATNTSALPKPSLYYLGPTNQNSMSNPIPTEQLNKPGLSANEIELPDMQGNQRGPGGGLGFGGGQQGGGGQPGGGGNQAGGQGGQGGGAITAGQGFAPEGLDRVVYDPTDGSLIVQGTEEGIRQLRNLVDLFDQVPRQVLIKVEFITTSQSVARSLGFDWLYQRGAINAGNRPGSFARVGDPVFVNYATGNVTTRMRTFLQDGNGKTVNAPLVRTLNNQVASVFQTIQTTIFVSQIASTGGSNITIPQPVPVSVTTGLIVRPRINDDGYVTMTLNPQIADFGQLKRGPDGQEIPDQIVQAMSVVARVKSGSTIALAGLTRKQFTDSVIRFPILSDLPIVGQFFKSNAKNRDDAETLIFVTPIIVEDDDAGGLQP